MSWKRFLFQLICSIAIQFALGPFAAATPVYYAATDQQIKSAPCQSADLMSDDKILVFFRNQPGFEERVDFTFQGRVFKNESKVLVELFQRLMIPLEDSSMSRYKLQSQCTQLKCLIGDMVGLGNELKVLYLLKAHNVNVSPFALGGGKRLTSEQLQLLIQTLRMAPSHLSYFHEEIRVLRVDPRHKGLGLEDVSPNTAARTLSFGILLFDFWSKLSPEKQRYIFWHELAHVWSEQKAMQGDPLDMSSEWLSATGWEMIPTVPDPSWENRRKEDQRYKDQWVSDYAKTNSVEDFAESVASYRFNGDHLKRTNPQRYEYLQRRLFRGTEYLLSHPECVN